MVGLLGPGALRGAGRDDGGVEVVVGRGADPAELGAGGLLDDRERLTAAGDEAGGEEALGPERCGGGHRAAASSAARR